MKFNISQKIDNVVSFSEKYLTETPPPPISVKIELMRSCNYKCEFCYHSQLSKNKGQMDFELYKKIIDELYSIGVKEIAPFFFGESFLSPILPDAIKYAKDKGFEYVFCTTNGSVCTSDKLLACMKAGLNSLKFSFNYADEKQFSEKTKVSSKYFDIVKNNIKEAKRIRDEGNYNCGLYASYILYDEYQKEKMKTVLEEISPYLDEIYALPLYNQTSKIKQQKFTGGNQGRADNPVSPLPCWTLFKEGHINYDGTVCCCCFSVGEEFTMGDLKTQSFMEIWHSEKFKELRRNHLKQNVIGTVCQNCIIDCSKK